MQDLDKFKNEMNLSGQNVYVGHRYVPKIFGEWDNTKIYEPLSIVQYQGASYTSRQYVPVGVELTNEEYWVVTGNYNAQVEQYRQDVRNLTAHVDTYDELITTQGNEIDEINVKLGEITVFTSDFKEASDPDDTLSINRALAFVSTNGGGKVFIDGNVTLSDTIHVLPKTELYSSDKKTTVLFTGETMPVLNFYKDSKVHNLNVEVPLNYASSALFFKSKNMDNKEKVIVHDVKIKKAWDYYSSNESIGFYLLGDSTVGNSGIWNVIIHDCEFEGFTKISKLETIGEGWVNGNQFYNIIGVQFGSVVEVVQSTESKGIDMNTYSDFNLQVSQTTGEVFKDATSSNTYNEFTIWDIKFYENASLGYANNIVNRKMMRRNEQTLISGKLYPDLYTKLGTFRKVLTRSDFVVIKIKAPTIDSEITVFGAGLNLLHSNIKNFGYIKLNNDNLKFYYVINDNGYVDLYYHVIGINMDVNVVIANKLGFMIDDFQNENAFDSVTNAIEVTRVNINNTLEPLNLIKRKSSVTTIPNATPTKIIFDENDIDVVSSKDITTDGNGDFTILKTGIYELKITLIFNANDVGYRSIGFYKNTIKLDPSLQVNPVKGEKTILNASRNIVIGAGDKVSAYAIQTSGAELDVSTQAEFSITMLKDTIN